MEGKKIKTLFQHYMRAETASSIRHTMQLLCFVLRKLFRLELLLVLISQASSF